MVFHRKSLLDIVVVSAALVVSIFAFANSGEARLARTAQSQEQVSVVGHLDLQGMQVKQIFVQQRSGKSYLLLRRADQDAFAIVNVSDPAKPLLADRDVFRQPAGAEVDLPEPGSTLAIALYPGNYLPGHTTFDLSLGKSFAEKYSISVTALNVANRHVLLDNSVTFGGFHYNDPRQIYAEFRYRFHY